MRILVPPGELVDAQFAAIGEVQLTFDDAGERLAGSDHDILFDGPMVWASGGEGTFVRFRFPVTSTPAPFSVVGHQDGQASGCPQYANLDFDGDGVDDFAIFRPELGIWAILKSSVQQTDLIYKQWGLPGDRPMPGDYTGDGKADLVVWRPTDGNWYTCPSEFDFDCSQATIVQFGLPGDVPIKGDFDGDRLLDFAVWRPSEGNFYYRSTRTGETIVRQWGLPGDIPLMGGQGQ